MNLLMLLAKPRLKSLLLIVIMIVKLTQKKMLNLQLFLYTLFQYVNKKLSRNSLRKTSIWVLFNQPPLYMIYQSYSSRRKIVYYPFVSTFIVLTVSPKRIAIYFHSFLIYLTHFIKLEYIQRQIFAMLATWFTQLMVMNGKLLLEYIIDYLSSL